MDSPAVMDHGRGHPRLLRASLLLTGFLMVPAAVAVLGPSGLSDGAVPALAQTAPTSTPRPLVFDRSTATPTPRVVAIPGPTSRSTSTPAPAAPTGNTPRAATSPVTAPTPTASPTPSPSPSPAPSPSPSATPVPPTQTPTTLPTPALSTRVAFTAADWSGGYYRGDALAYGRPWVALYGAQSAYSRAVLTVTLDDAAAGPATLTLTGLDDEWAAANDLALEVNGQRVFTGPSPFLNWDGVGTGAGAAWTAVAFELPVGLLRTGSNEIAVANLTSGANFGVPPYVLLAEAALELPAGATTESGPATTVRDPTAVPAAPSTSAAVAFGAADWTDGYFRGDALAYGRPWVAVYGAQSDYPRAVLAFALDTSPSGPSRLTLTGLDDEWTGSTLIELTVDGQLIFAGPSPFASWDGIGEGSGAAWTTVTFELPAGLLIGGRNEVAIANLAPTANFGTPPYVLLADASLEVSGAGVGE